MAALAAGSWVGFARSTERPEAVPRKELRSTSFVEQVMREPSPSGGAVTQYYGSVMGPGFYMPYTFSGYTPGFYGGWGFGGGF